MRRRDTKPASPDGARPALAGLRACVVLEAPEVGGAEMQALLLAQHLIHRERCHVEVWTILPGSADGLRKQARARGVPLLELDWAIPTAPHRRVAMLADLARRMRAARVDVILPFTSLPNMLCGLAYRLSGARTCVWNERAAPLPSPSWAQRLAAALTPIFISNSRLGSECLTRTYGTPPERIHVVNNGLALLPPVDGREAWRRRLGVSPDAIVVCMVANIHARKDHATAIRGFQLALERSRAQGGREGLFVCAGSLVEHTHRALLALSAELGVGDRVVFPGSVADISGLLSAADIGVFCSHLEGTPNGILESMAMGLPVVATDLPGVRDIFGPEGEGWLIPTGDAEGLASRVLRLMNEPDLRRDVGRRNRAIVEEQFTAESMGERTADVIRRAIA